MGSGCAGAHWMQTWTQLPGADARAPQLCAHVSRIVEHAADGTVASRALAAPLAVISRAALVDALLAKLEERVQALRNAGHNPMVHVRFDTKVVGVELDSRVLRIITPGVRNLHLYACPAVSYDPPV